MLDPERSGDATRPCICLIIGGCWAFFCRQSMSCLLVPLDIPTSCGQSVIIDHTLEVLVMRVPRSFTDLCAAIAPPLQSVSWRKEASCW